MFKAWLKAIFMDHTFQPRSGNLGDLRCLLGRFAIRICENTNNRPERYIDVRTNNLWLSYATSQLCTWFTSTARARPHPPLPAPPQQHPMAAMAQWAVPARPHAAHPLTVAPRCRTPANPSPSRTAGLKKVYATVRVAVLPGLIGALTL